MSEVLRVIVADDHPLFRDGVVSTLGAEEGIKVVAEASTGEEATRATIDLLPDLLVLDLSMPGGGGIEAIRNIAVSCPSTNILVLTVSESPDDLFDALKAGASGYVLKGSSGAALVHAVRAVAAGEVYVTRTLAGTILHRMTRDEGADPFEELTPREHDILGLVAKGHTNREIGERLYLSEKTVKHYMTNVLRKLHVRSRVEAALLAQRRDLEGT